MAGARRRRGAGRDGFLLVEALSALALSALIIGALLAFTGLLRRSADSAAARVETMETTNRTVWTMAYEIRQATRARWAPEERELEAARAETQSTDQGRTPTQSQTQTAARSSGDQDGSGNATPAAARGGAAEPEGQGGDKAPERNFVFAGTPERIVFALAPEQPSGLRAPVMVAYEIDAAGALLRAEGAIRADARGPAEVRLGPVARVAPGPERLRFAYVAKEPDGPELVTDDWTDQRRMPAAVRIDRLDPATGASRGSLRVPLLITGEPGCANPERSFCSRAEAAKTGQPGQAGQPGATGARPGGGEPE